MILFKKLYCLCLLPIFLLLENVALFVSVSYYRHVASTYLATGLLSSCDPDPLFSQLVEYLLEGIKTATKPDHIRTLIQCIAAIGYPITKVLFLTNLIVALWDFVLAATCLLLYQCL